MANAQNLTQVKRGQYYEVISVEGEEDTISFLFSLGCRPGAEIYFKAKRGSVYILVIENQRYGIDQKIAKNLFLKESAGRR